MFIISLELYLVSTLVLGYMNYDPICLTLKSEIEGKGGVMMSTLDFYRAVLIIGMMFAFVFSIPIAKLIYIQVGNYLSNKTTYLRYTKYPGLVSDSQKNYDALDLEYSTESEPSSNQLSNARIRSQEMPSENIPNHIRFNRSTPPPPSTNF